MSETVGDVVEIVMARQVITASLAEAWRRPIHSGSLCGSSNPFPRDGVRAAWDLLLLEGGSTGLTSCHEFTESTLVDDLIAWLELDPTLRERAIDSVFGLVIPKDCPPYETEYLPWNDPTHRAQHLADIAGFYQAFGLEPDPHHPERQDHLSLELGFTAFLLKKVTVLNRADGAPNPERGEITTKALATFLQDHLLWWVPVFNRNLESRIRDRAIKEERPVQEALTLMTGVSRLLKIWVALFQQSYSIEASHGPPSMRGYIAIPGPTEELERLDCMTCEGR